MQTREIAEIGVNANMGSRLEQVAVALETGTTSRIPLEFL